MLLAIDAGLDDIAVVASRYDTRFIGCARQNGAGADRYTPFAALARKQQRLLAEAKDSRWPEKMHADDR